MVWKFDADARKIDFRLWLVLFPILNAVDIIQTWLFFQHETNPLFVSFPSVIFVTKILWAFLVPLVLYVFYGKKPRMIYTAALALVLLYLAIVLVNLFNIL
jgi:hypothetical protein